MSTAPVTESRLREVVIYDPFTGAFTAKVNRGKLKAGAVLGSASHGYLMIFVDWRRYSAHRLAWLYMFGVWPNGIIDHINGDRSDNRMANLRCVSQGTNLENQRAARSNNHVGLLGVGRAQSNTRGFRARIRVDGKERHLGAFHTAEEAHRAYLVAKRQLHTGCAI